MGGSRSALEVALRREFFARVGGLAIRYNVTPDQVLSHCRRHRPSSPLGASRMVGHLEDLTLVAGCLAHVGLAWSDLVEANELSLIRGLRDRVSEPEAVMIVRRWLRALRLNSLGREDDPAPSLGRYPGVKPLRHWLAERLTGELTRTSILPPGRRLRLTGQQFGPSMSSSVGS